MALFILYMCERHCHFFNSYSIILTIVLFFILICSLLILGVPNTSALPV